MIGKTALISGASYGIGLELAKLMASKGHDLVLLARTKMRLCEIQKNLQDEYGIEVYVIVCDLSLPNACEGVYQKIKMMDLEIDILINNAAIGDWGLFVDSNIEKQKQMLQLNIVALTDLTRLFLPGMVKRRTGKIMNIASTAAFQPGPLMAVYYASKAYVLSFSSALAQELKGSGVTVTCLCPGPTATHFQGSTFPNEVRLTDGQRLADPDDVAKYGIKAMLKGQVVAVHGVLNRIMAINVRFLPQWIILPLVHFMQDQK